MEEFKTILYESPDLVPIYLETHAFIYTDYDKMMDMVRSAFHENVITHEYATFLIKTIKQHRLEAFNLNISIIRKFGCNNVNFVDDGKEKPLIKPLLIDIAQQLGFNVDERTTKRELCALIDRAIYRR